MKKLFVPFVMTMFLCFSLVACASDTQGPGSEFDVAEAEIIEMGEGHTRIISGDVIVDDIITEDYREITTYIGDDVSVSYEDFNTGILTVALNGQVVDMINLEDFRNETKSTWNRPNEYVIVFGFAILLIVGLLGLGVWMHFRKK